MEMKKNSSIGNIYKLDGRVPVGKAIPFGLQHILAMFVANLAPITIIAGAAQPALSQAQVAVLLQNAMFVAGIATLVQLYPIWRIGSRLPVVMGVSFTFVAVLSAVAGNYGYPAVIGAVLIGGLMEGTLGLLVKNWSRVIPPIVSASVVTAIGYSLFTVGTRSFGGGYADDFGSASNLGIGFATLVVCLLWNILAKGYVKQLSVLAVLFGCPPVTSFSQNVGLIAMTKVVNRFTIMTGAVCMILAGLLPPIGNFFASLPEPVLGGCTIMMFGTILTSGIQMIARCGFSQRNITIASLSLAVGIGFTSASESGIWGIFPELVRTVFAENVVAVVFVIAIILNLLLPADMDIKKAED